uniref:Uncharacterized protein n=1 Tax=Lotharella globosa TaxID=91324 RepID=A0A6V3NAH0_9EUKA
MNNAPGMFCSQHSQTFRKAARASSSSSSSSPSLLSSCGRLRVLKYYYYYYYSYWRKKQQRHRWGCRGGGPWERINLTYSSPNVWAGPDYQKPYACARGRPVSIWHRNKTKPWVDSPFISRKMVESPPKGTHIRKARDRVYQEEVQESPDYASRHVWKGNRKLGEPLTPILPFKHNKSFIKNTTEFGYQDIHMPHRGISTNFLRGLIFVKDQHKWNGIGIFNLSSGKQLSDFEGRGDYEVATLDRTRVTPFGYARTKEMDYATLDEQPTRLDAKEWERPGWLLQSEKQFMHDMPAYYKMIQLVAKRKRWDFWQYLQGFYRKNRKKLAHMRMSLCPLCVRSTQTGSP